MRDPKLLFPALAVVFVSVLWADTGLISTVAGVGQPGSAGVGGPATSAYLNTPQGICLDQSGNLFIVEMLNHRVSRVDAATGILTVVAGTGVAGYSGDNGPATQAKLNYPESCAFGAAGNLFVSDTWNNVVRRIDASTGTITTVAGNGTGAFAGDGGPATAASLYYPAGLALDAAGNLYIADSGNYRIRRVDASSGWITTVAGTGNSSPFGGDGGPATSANLKSPYGVAVDASNNLYISDPADYRIRRVDGITGAITTIAGNGTRAYTSDGASAVNLGAFPVSLALDGSDYLYFADGTNGRVRRVNLLTGAVVTVAGRGVSLSQESTGDGGLATSASMNYAAGLARAANGNLFVSENGGLQSPGGGGGIYPGNGSQIVRRIFLPSPYAYTNTGLASSPSTGTAGDPVTFTASVVALEGGGTPTGTVEFYDSQFLLVGVSETLLGSAPLLDGAASLTTTALGARSNGAGNHYVTALYTGDPVFSSSGSPQVLVTMKAIPTVTVWSNQSVADPGQTVTLTATVTPAAYPLGTVEFRDGDVSLGSVALNWDTATLNVSFTEPGDHPITARYSGDASFAAAVSAVFIQQVRARTATTTSVSATPNPAPLGSSVTIGASVSPAAATGSIEFRVDGAAVATVALAGGQASLGYSSMTAGNHVITAVYSGDESYIASTSQPLAQVVTTTTQIALTATPSPSQAGQTVQFSARISPSAAPGSVQFLDGATALGSATLDQGLAQISISTLTAGDHSVTAVYTGDSVYLGSTSNALVQTVVKINTSLVPAASPNPSVFGQTVTLTATITPAAASGQVRFKDGEATLGTAAVAGGVASLAVSQLAAGDHSIVMIYDGDATYLSCITAPMVAIVSKADPSLSVSSGPNPSAYGQQVVFRASVAPAATGTVVFREGSTTLGTATVLSGSATLAISTLASGSRWVTMDYSGDGSYLSASSSVMQNVGKRNASLTVSSNPNPSTWGQAVTLSASILPADATGSVQFKDGITAIGTATLVNGVAVLTIPALAVGSHVISAVYSGDASYLEATSPGIAHTVLKANPTVAAGASPNPAVVGQTVTLAATVAPAAATGSVQFIDGSATLGTAPLVSGAATLAVTGLAAGSHPITVVYSGDGFFNSAASSPLPLTVNGMPTTTTLTSSANPVKRNKSVTFTARVSPTAATGTVQFLDGTALLGSASVSGGTARLTVSFSTTGTHSITAQYGGSATYAGSVSAPLIQTVKN